MRKPANEVGLLYLKKSVQQTLRDRLPSIAYIYTFLLHLCKHSASSAS
jgi:hypothetical protein